MNSTARQKLEEVLDGFKAIKFKAHNNTPDVIIEAMDLAMGYCLAIEASANQYFKEEQVQHVVMCLLKSMKAAAKTKLEHAVIDLILHCYPVINDDEITVH